MFEKKIILPSQLEKITFFVSLVATLFYLLELKNVLKHKLYYLQGDHHVLYVLYRINVVYYVYYICFLCTICTIFEL